MMDRLLSLAIQRVKAIDSVVEELASEIRIDCAKGCAYCCYGVPLWVRAVELYHLLDALNSLSIKERKTIARRLREYEREYEESARMQGYLPQSPIREEELDINRLGAICGLGMNEVPCPFLNSEDSSCMVYEARPSMCRLTLFSDREVCRKDWENPIAFIWKNEIEPFQRKLREKFLQRWKEHLKALQNEYPDLDISALERTFYFLPAHLSFDPVKKRFRLRGEGSL